MSNKAYHYAKQEETTMARIARRKLLKLNRRRRIAGGRWNSATGGIAGAALRPGCQCQLGKVGTDFITGSDELLKKEIAPAAAKALGIKTTTRDNQRQRFQRAPRHRRAIGLGTDVISPQTNWTTALCGERRDVTTSPRDRQGPGGSTENSQNGRQPPPR